MDALSHALESMMSRSRTPVTLALATQTAALLHAHLEPAVLAGDVDARGQLLYAAHLAGLALNAGVVIGHSLAYVVARHSPMPHGTICALALPCCLANNLGMPPGVADAVAAAASGGRTTDIDVAARYVADLSARLGLPSSLEGVGIATSELDLMALETVRDGVHAVERLVRVVDPHGRDQRRPEPVRGPVDLQAVFGLDDRVGVTRDGPVRRGARVAGDLDDRAAGVRRQAPRAVEGAAEEPLGQVAVRVPANADAIVGGGLVRPSPSRCRSGAPRPTRTRWPCGR